MDSNSEIFFRSLVTSRACSGATCWMARTLSLLVLAHFSGSSCSCTRLSSGMTTPKFRSMSMILHRGSNMVSVVVCFSLTICKVIIIKHVGVLKPYFDPPV